MSRQENRAALKLPGASKPSARYTGTALLMLLASLPLMLSGCSTMRLEPPPPELPANLAADCPAPPPRPVPFLDPLRLAWELAVLAMYGDCAGRHHSTVKVWPKGG